MTQRWKLTIEYDGTPFAGWQIQENAPSVQGEIQKAIKAFSGQETVETWVAGRTDAGVHALGQVAHVDLEREWTEKTVRDAINAHLRPHPISIIRAEHVAPDFNARTSAKKRTYCYKMITGRLAPPVLYTSRVWH